LEEKDASDSSEGVTGVEALKRKRRQKEADEFFEQMTKDDPLLKKMQERKR
jgi:hypothetical protein